MSSDFIGKAIIVSAPSGAGKTTLVKHLILTREDISFSVSATNRPKRASEKNGIDYHFLDTEEFKERIKAKDFLEWEEVYENRFYGTLKSEVDRIWKDNKHVIFDVDVLGGIHLKKKLKERALSIFVSPGNIETLEKRLVSRGTDSDMDVAIRLEKAAEEMEKAADFDVILVNEKLEKAQEEILKLGSKFLNNA